MRQICESLLAVALLLAVVVGAGTQVVAWSSAGEWAEPVNLSRSGAASNPALVVVPDGSLRALWWDHFEGLMVADGRVPLTSETELATGESEPGSTTWSEPARVPILMVQAGQAVTTPTPIDVVPRIVGDAAGRAHAFWLGVSDEETGNQPLHYSRLAAGRISWSRPLTLSVPAAAFDAAADLSGTLHVAYVQRADVGRSPSGLYYRRSGDGGASWNAPAAILQSRYLRLLPTEGDALRLTAHDANHLTVAWHDPRQGQIVVTQSTDGGSTWQAPRPLAASDGIPLHGQVVTVPGQSERLLWPLAGVPGSQLAASSSGDAVTVALWDGEQWTATRRLDVDLQDSELGQALGLVDLRLAVAPAQDPEGDGGTLAVLGVDAQGDLWLTGMSIGALADLLALPAGTSTESELAGEPGPVNLSKSGAALDPALVSGPDGRMHAFWWDQFDGLTVADGVVSASTVMSGTEEIVVLRDAWSEPRTVPVPAPSTPWIVSDASGRIHAFWQQTPENATTDEEVSQPLLYSQLSADGAAWSSPVVLAESAQVYAVVPDLSGRLHLAYLVKDPSATSPAGVYYRQTGDDGTGWSATVTVHASRYLRLLTVDTAHMRLVTDEAGGIYLTWDDPRMARAVLAYSPDSGSTWQAPVEVGEAEAGSRRGRLAASAGGDVLVLWETGQGTSGCDLHQAPAGAVLDGSAGDGQRVLEGLSNCPGDERFLALDEGRMLMIAGTGGEAVTVALWNGEGWSEAARLGTNFEDAEMDRMVYLGDLHTDLIRVPSASAGGETVGALVALGTDGAGDVWATNSQVGDLEMVFAAPSAWSTPVRVSEGGAHQGLPAVATGAEGFLHALWSEAVSADEPGTALFYTRWDGTQWTQPAAVLSSGDGKTDEPALVAVGDRLHAVWSGRQSGEVLYGHAFALDAYASSGWSAPVPLPAPGEVGSRPDIVASPDGTLHVVYAVPLNEGRGIYYTRSADGGESWSPARQLFDAAAEGWLIADHPQMVVDERGLLHVAWVRSGLPAGGKPAGVYYANSYDGGETWSEAFEVAAGTHAWPQVASGGAGQVHVVWSETNGQPGWWHRWSVDAGQTWTRQERVPGFESVSAPASLLEGESGALYVTGLGTDVDGEPALLLVTWDGQRWGAVETFSLAVDGVQPGIAASIQPAMGRLEVIFCARSESEEDNIQPGIWHTGRPLPAVAVSVPPAVAPLLTTTPVPTPIATTTPQPTASFGAAPPALGESALPISVPLLAAGGLAALIVGGVMGGRFLWTRRR